jgi:Flp pilus assembly pilin Flp
MSPGNWRTKPDDGLFLLAGKHPMSGRTVEGRKQKDAKMKKLMKRLLKKEEGQAFAEYAVLFPGAIMIIIAMAFSLGQGLKQSYCEVVGMFSNGICADVAAGEPEEPEFTPTPTEEMCVVLVADEGCSQCDEHPDCICLPGVNEGTYEAENLQSLVIKAGKEYFVFQSGATDDGCYYVELEDTYAYWWRYEEGQDCKDVSHVQAWWVILCE